MNKFKIGQRVKIIKTGRIGRILEVDSEDISPEGYSNQCYAIKDEDDYKFYFTVHDLEEVNDILDPEEKEYLGNIIKPFKSRATSIRKAHSMIRDKYYETIEIYVKSLVLHYKYEVIVLPVFKTPMYKNMEINKEYTLEELGL